MVNLKSDTFMNKANTYPNLTKLTSNRKSGELKLISLPVIIIIVVIEQKDFTRYVNCPRKRHILRVCKDVMLYVDGISS